MEDSKDLKSHIEAGLKHEFLPEMEKKSFSSVWTVVKFSLKNLIVAQVTEKCEELIENNYVQQQEINKLKQKEAELEQHIIILQQQAQQAAQWKLDQKKTNEYFRSLLNDLIMKNNLESRGNLLVENHHC